MKKAWSFPGTIGTKVLLRVQLVMALGLSACSPFLQEPAPKAPVTPEDAKQVSDCQKYALWHNIGVVADATLTTASVATGWAFLKANNGHNLRSTGPIADAGFALGAAGIGTVIVTGILSRLYTDNGCTDLTGVLPYAKRHRKDTTP